MKKKVAEAWVKDLRKCHNQGQDALATDKGYCCLGRLCIVLGARFKKDLNGDRYPWLNGKQLREAGTLPSEIIELAGMNSDSGLFGTESLAGLNDSGVSFKKIADKIEENWRDL